MRVGVGWGGLSVTHWDDAPYTLDRLHRHSPDADLANRQTINHEKSITAMQCRSSKSAMSYCHSFGRKNLRCQSGDWYTSKQDNDTIRRLVHKQTG